MSLTAQFDRQVERLLALGYPRLAGLREADFMATVAPLRDVVPREPPAAGRTPFLLVLRGDLVVTERAMEVVSVHGSAGVVDMHPTAPEEYEPLRGLDLPDGPAYLITGVDTGRDLRGVTPDDAWDVIVGRGRSPLTIDEGIALVTHTHALGTKDAFSLLGSRRGDRRVPALWMSRGRPRLGWCWAGNPHGWLGSASCAGRIGPQG